MPIGAGLGAALSLGNALVGGLGNRSKTSTQTQTTKQKQKSKQSGTTSTRRNLLDEQQQVLSPLTGSILSRIQDPSAALQPLKTGAYNAVNRNFAGAGDALSAKFGRNTQGASGKYGRAATGLEIARLGGLGGVENQFANMAYDAQNQGMSQAMGLLGMNFGQTTDTSLESEGESEGNMTGSMTQPGNVLGGALGGGLEMMTSLMALNKLLGGSGGGNNAGYPGLPGRQTSGILPISALNPGFGSWSQGW